MDRKLKKRNRLNIILSTTSGVKDWTERHVEIVMERHGITRYNFNEWTQTVIFTTNVGKWKVVHDKEKVVLYHTNLFGRNSEPHFQDYFYTLNSSVKYAKEHDEYISNPFCRNY